MPISRQWVDKHVVTKAYREILGRPFLGNGTVNIPTNCRETVFSVGSAPRLCNVEFQVSSQSEVRRKRIEGVQRCTTE
jgi:hypothetical protein